MRPRTPPSPPRRPRTPTPPSSPAFVWKKKVDADRKRGVFVDDQQRRQDLQRELHDTKRRRVEREGDRQQREAEHAVLAREREAEQNKDWHQDTYKFDAQQHFMGQSIRITDGREKSLDLLAKYIRVDLGGNMGELEVSSVLQTMDEAEMNEILKGVKREMQFVDLFDSNNDNAIWNRAVRKQFWLCVQLCSMHRLGMIRGQLAEGVHGLVEEDIERVLDGMNVDTLADLDDEIAYLVDSGEGEVDFWTSTLKRVKYKTACMRLRKMSLDLIPERKSRNDTMKRQKREAAKEDDMVRREQEKGMAADEELFNDEVEAPSDKRRTSTSGYAWNDKFRPRKPKYFNRVYTGFNWTKYNRTHYDHDNPPPKTVQGYKFNIFYPDLIDPSKTPSFHVKSTDNPDVSIITFKAGPPYEDLAFKVVNRPWEKSHRKGYRCSFDHGVLQLWFHLQKYRYRR